MKSSRYFGEMQR